MMRADDQKNLQKAQDQITELQSKQTTIEQEKKTASLDNQEKCANQSQKLADKSTQLMNGGGEFIIREDHYNENLGKCFAVIMTIHYPIGNSSYWADIALYDAFEEQEYASGDSTASHIFIDNDSDFEKGTVNDGGKEYDAIVKKYMEE